MSSSSSAHDNKPRYRIISLDGGGIYGLVTAIWLRQICERDPHFLNGCSRLRDQKGGEGHVFAGASSGAINALLLARHEKPREALLSGELERFWKQAGVFSNDNPMTAWLSLMSVGAWYNTEEFLAVLRDYFGDLTMDDLKHDVLVGVFNWTGEGGASGSPAAGSEPWQKWQAAFAAPRAGFDPAEMMRQWAGSGLGFHPHAHSAKKTAATSTSTSAGESDGPASWKPESFTNFLRDDPAGPRRSVVDVAYGAAAAAGYRAIRGGIGDAATYSVNPAVQTIAALVHYERWPQGGATRTRAAHAEDFDVGSALTRMSMLSVGDGVINPAYWLKNFDLGFQQLGMIPTNPLAGQFFPPSFLTTLEGPTEAGDFAASELLGGHKYCRLDPGILYLPTLVASGLARFPFFRSLVNTTIYDATGSERSQRAVSSAATFVKGWRWEQPTATG